jgi:signal transduction histidine kinase
MPDFLNRWVLLSIGWVQMILGSVLVPPSFAQTPAERRGFRETLGKLQPIDTNYINTLYKYGGTFELENDDSARYWYDRAHELSKKANYIDGQLRFRSYVSILLINVGKYDEGMRHVDTAFDLSVKHKRRRFIAIEYNTYGTIWQYKSEMHKAAENYMKAYEIAEDIRDTLLMNGVAGNLSGIFLDIRRFDKAREFSQINYDLADAVHDTLSVGYGLVNLSSCDLHDRNYSVAFRRSGQAIRIAYQYADEELELFASANLGNSLLGLNKLDTAMIVWNKMRSRAMETGISYHRMFAAQGLGETYNRKQFPAEAIHFFEEALYHARQAENKPRQAEILRALAFLYEATGRLDQSVKHWKRFHELNDSINIVEQNRNISDLEASYQNEKKQRELSEKNLLIEQEKNKSTARLFWIAGMLVLLITAFVLILQRIKISRVREQNLKSEMEMKVLKAGDNERTRIAKDLHDDVGATLSSIHIYSKAAQMHLRNKPEEVPALIERISENSERMMDKMSDIIWSMNSNEDSGEKLALRIKTFASEILGSKDIETVFELDTLEILDFPIIPRKNLLLIFKEAINNIAKYSRAQRVNFRSWSENGDLKIEIADDGVGFDLSHARNGNGLGNMKHRAEFLRGELVIISSPGQGSVLKLSIPLARISDVGRAIF